MLHAEVPTGVCKNITVMESFQKSDDSDVSHVDGWSFGAWALVLDTRSHISRWCRVC